MSNLILPSRFHQRGSITHFQSTVSVDVAPDLVISPLGNGQVNSVIDPANCFAGVRFNSNGTESECVAASGAFTVSQGDWLDSGNAADVWIERIVTAGGWNNLDPGTGRHQLSTTRDFRVFEGTVNATESVTGTFKFWDAATGGSLITETASATYSARVDEDIPFCFTPWTLITMADGMTMRIVDVRAGDLIQVQDGVEPVTKIITQTNHIMYLVKFADGRWLEMSDDHPIYVGGKGYAAINPRSEYKDLGVAEQLGVGDGVLGEDGDLNKISSIELMDYSKTVYTLENSKFYANGMLVY